MKHQVKSYCDSNSSIAGTYLSDKTFFGDMNHGSVRFNHLYYDLHTFQLNHFPGSFQIGRKDRLWRNLSKMQVHFGKKEFGFFPQTYCLPMDSKLLKRAFEDGGTKQKWIIKPVRK